MKSHHQIYIQVYHLNDISSVAPGSWQMVCLLNQWIHSPVLQIFPSTVTVLCVATYVMTFPHIAMESYTTTSSPAVFLSLSDQ